MRRTPASAPNPSRARGRPHDAAVAGGGVAASRTASAPRDRAATEERLLEAVGQVLAREGFAALGINAVAKHAGVDKVLIYRYFGGLAELLRAWGDSGRFWPSVADLLQREPELPQQPAAERYARFFEHFIDELRARPLTLEILAAEVNDRNELTAILETEREQWGQEATRVLGGAEFAALPQARALTLLLVAGVQYLLVRSRKLQVFGGLGLRTDEGWVEIKRAVRATALQLFPPPRPQGPKTATKQRRPGAPA
jgi:AcrR family transcriptional regulator